MTRDRLVFRFKGGAVGHFEERQYPSAPGRYRYMPYRSSSHYFMGREFATKGHALCDFDDGDRMVEFTILSRPEYGVLELGDFHAEPK